MSDWPSGITYRPIVMWPGKHTARRISSPFSTSRKNILEEFRTELRMHQARNAVLQVALRESQLRNDGLPRAGVVPEHPGVILTFETPDGSLSFPCDSFTHWEDNLLAIVRTMNKLRAVARYGVTKGSEQYTAWRALEAPAPAGFRSSGDVDLFLRPLIDFAGNESWATMIRKAKANTHPDRGGDRDKFHRVVEAETFLRDAGLL